MTQRSLLVVVLAAGKGTRMKSRLPKILHSVAGRSLLGHVLALTQRLDAARLAVVIGPEMADVRAEALALAPTAQVFVQEHQRGTADAVLAARDLIAAHDGDVLVLFADTPLLEPETLLAMRARLSAGDFAVVLGFRLPEPGGYGRLLTDDANELLAIREAADASPAEQAVTLCNSGVIAFRSDGLMGVLDDIGTDNAKGEYYLTDAIGLARGTGRRASVIECPQSEVLGINSRSELAEAEAIFQARARARALADGVTMIAPETVYLSHDTELARDVVIEPHVVFGPGVRVAEGARINAYCHMQHARIGPGAIVGPFARLRPGADIGADARIGNFVEVKNAHIETGAKANHLSYIGDARVGERANIGAGTIFCNYDGFFKHHTDVGNGVFIGSNSSLVAPVKIGDGAYIGSGTVVTKDVSANALALARAPQEERPGWGDKFRKMMARRKAKAG